MRLGNLSKTVSAASTEMTVKTFKFDAKILGRAGRYTVETDERKKGGILLGFLKSGAVEGLLIIAADGESLDILEPKEMGSKIYKAEKIR